MNADGRLTGSCRAVTQSSNPVVFAHAGQRHDSSFTNFLRQLRSFQTLPGLDSMVIPVYENEGLGEFQVRHV